MEVALVSVAVVPHPPPSPHGPTVNVLLDGLSVGPSGSGEAVCSGRAGREGGQAGWFLGEPVLVWQGLPAGGKLGQHQGSGGIVAPSGLPEWPAGAGTPLKGRGAAGSVGVQTGPRPPPHGLPSVGRPQPMPESSSRPPRAPVPQPLALLQDSERWGCGASAPLPPCRCPGPAGLGGSLALPGAAGRARPTVPTAAAVDGETVTGPPLPSCTRRRPLSLVLCRSPSALPETCRTAA